jgi:hypothetical protein
VLTRRSKRELLIGGLALCAISLVVLALALQLAAGTALGNNVAVASVFVFVAAFAIGPGVTFWAVLNASFPEPIAFEVDIVSRQHVKHCM